MSAPLILPTGNDRSWTKEFYRNINKVFRRIWYEKQGDKLVENAYKDAITLGIGYWRV